MEQYAGIDVSLAPAVAAAITRAEWTGERLADRMFVADGAYKSTTVARVVHRRRGRHKQGDQSCNQIARFLLGSWTPPTTRRFALDEQQSESTAAL